jgi:hypothetical protein
MKHCITCHEASPDGAVLCKFCGGLLRQLPTEVVRPSRLKALVMSGLIGLGGAGGMALLIRGLDNAPLSTSSDQHASSDDASAHVHQSASTASTPRLPQTVIDDIERTVSESQRLHAVTRIDVAGHEVDVDPAALGVWTADAKRAFAQALATYCDLHTSNTGTYFVDVFDSRSAKKIAHYGPFGFEAY